MVAGADGAHPRLGSPAAQSRLSSAGGGGRHALHRQGSSKAGAETDMATHSAVVSATRGYVMALLLFLLVWSLGICIAVFVHGYSLTDALYWAIGCMTTAGGDLKADSDVLKVVYIMYMPIAAVAALTAARTILQTHFLREVRLDQYELKVHSLLQAEARARKDRSVAMRESDFVIAVLKARKLVDDETVEAIGMHFQKLTKITPHRAGESIEKIIDAKVVFRHLVRQERIVSKARRPEQERGTELLPLSAEAHRTQVAYVDVAAEDEGFEEWFKTYWSPSVDHEDQDADDEEAPSPTPASPAQMPPTAAPIAAGHAYVPLVEEKGDYNA